MGAPIKHTCGDIDSYIKRLKALADRCRNEARQCSKDFEDFDTTELEDIAYDISGLIVDVEDLRTSNSNIRDWGESQEERGDILEAELSEANDKCAILEEEASKLDEKVNDLTDQLSAAHKTIDSLLNTDTE